MGHRTWSTIPVHLFSFRASVWHNRARSYGTQTVSGRFCSQCFSSVEHHRDMTRPGAKQQLSGFSCATLTFELQRCRPGELQTKLKSHLNIHLRLAECPFLWLDVVAFDCILVSIIKVFKSFYTFPSKVVSPVLVGRQTELRWWQSWSRMRLKTLLLHSAGINL